MADRFIVGYSGNLGRAHELGTLLDAAKRLRHRLDIVFLIIGEGNQKAVLQQEAIRRGLVSVLFKPCQPKAQLKFSFTLPDVHRVSLKAALEGLIVPSKFYSSLAAGAVHRLSCWYWRWRDRARSGARVMRCDGGGG